MAAILLVEDEKAVRDVLTRMLEGAGHAVTPAADGTAALRLIDLQSFDLIVADLLLPDTDGMQILRELRARKSPLKMIAISGGGRGSATDYLEMAKILGAVETLQKPIAPATLVAAVARVLDPA